MAQSQDKGTKNDAPRLVISQYLLSNIAQTQNKGPDAVVAFQASSNPRPDAPKLLISQITAISAKVEVRSDLKNGDILNRARYRAVRRDDEEADKWTDVEFERNTDHQTITRLNANTKYEIYGLYTHSQVMDSVVWSQQSEPITFCTLNAKWKEEVVFTNWMRTVVSARNMSGKHLMDLVMRYYPLLELQWDPKRTNRDLKLSNDNKRFTKIIGDDYRSLCSKNTFSADLLSLIRWEVTLKHKDSDNGDGIDLKMGFVDAEHIEDFKDWQRLGNGKHEEALWFEEDENPMILTNRDITLIHETMTFQPQIGDRIRLDFDFEKREVAAFYNAELLGLITSDLPKSVYLAASLYWEGSSFETTLFETF